MTTHQCPATGCPQRIAGSSLMCKPHWYMVPKTLRAEVWAAWASGKGAGTPEHRDAILAAVEAVNEKLAVG